MQDTPREATVIGVIFQRTKRCSLIPSEALRTWFVSKNQEFHLKRRKVRYSETRSTWSEFSCGSECLDDTRLPTVWNLLYSTPPRNQDDLFPIIVILTTSRLLFQRRALLRNP